MTAVTKYFMKIALKYEATKRGTKSSVSTGSFYFGMKHMFLFATKKALIP